MNDDQFKAFSTAISTQKFNRAFTLSDNAFRLNKSDADAIGARGVAKFYLKDLTCLDDLNVAVDMESENGYRYSSRAYILDALGDSESAVLDYKKAVELDPEDYIAYNNLGMLEEKLGRKELADRSFIKSDELLGLDKKQGRYKFAEPILQHQLNAEKELNLAKSFANTFTSKEGWQNFFKFVQQKLSRK